MMEVVKGNLYSHAGMEIYTQIPQCGSAAESPKKREDPNLTNAIIEGIEQLRIGRKDDIFTQGPTSDESNESYSDLYLERDIFGGKTYEEFDEDYRYQNKSYDSSEKKEYIYGSQYKAFRAFPGSKTKHSVYLQEVKSIDQFNRWVYCLIGQIKLAGLGEFIPDKFNGWSKRMILNEELSNAIAYIWERCVEQNNCPKWVYISPYNSGISSTRTVYNLLKKYNKMNKGLDIWRETIRHTDTEKLPSDLHSLWIQGTEVYNNFFVKEKYKDVESLKAIFNQMIVENYAERSYLVRQELIKNNDLDLSTALDLIVEEVFSSNVNRSAKAKLLEDEESKKSHNQRSSWKNDNNGSEKNGRFNRANTKFKSTKYRNKTNHIKAQSFTDD